MEALSREELIKELNQAYPEIKLRTTEEFSGSTGGLWVTSTEDGTTGKDGHLLFNYYSQDSEQNKYIFGVIKALHNFLEKRGWYGEWNDPGTMMLWEA